MSRLHLARSILFFFFVCNDMASSRNLNASLRLLIVYSVNCRVLLVYLCTLVILFLLSPVLHIVYMFILQIVISLYVQVFLIFFNHV